MRVPRFVSSQTFHDVHCAATTCDDCKHYSHLADECEIGAGWIAGAFPSKYFDGDDRRRYAAMMRRHKKSIRG